MSGQFLALLLLGILAANDSNYDNQNLSISSALAHLKTLKRSFNASPFQITQTHPSKTSIFLLLLLSGDIQLNPGPRPPKLPCGVCSKAVKWDHLAPSVCCDSCNVWYHQGCMAMPDAVFEGLKNVSWECVKCGLPNFSLSQSLYHSPPPPRTVAMSGSLSSNTSPSHPPLLSV